MKVKLHSSLKTPYIDVSWMEEGQLIFQAGNNLCIKDISKNTEEFIPLNKNLTHMYSFITSPNHKNIFTAESSQYGVEVCSYLLTGQRKSFKISELPSFMPSNAIETIQLLSDQFDSSIVFGVAKNKTQACVFLIDMAKLKLISIGFINYFQCMKLYSNDTYSVSVSGKSFVKILKAFDGAWAIQEKLPKRQQNLQIVAHEHLSGDRLLLVTLNQMFILQDSQIIQTIQLSNGQNNFQRILNINNKTFIVFLEGAHIKIFNVEGQNEELSLLQQKTQNIGNKTKIRHCSLSRHQEEILLQFENGSLYHWRIQQFLQNIKTEENITFKSLVYSFCEDSDINVGLSSNKNISLISNGKKVTLWDLNKNVPIIVSEFSSLQYEKPVRSCALNPNGHSFCLAFNDRIRFYIILMNKFHQSGQIMLKKCSLIQYCHGGQYMACSFGRGMNSILTIINTLSLRQIHSFKMSSSATSIVFHEHDDQIYVSNQAKVVTLFKISSLSKVQDFPFKQPIKHMRYDYSNKKLLVSVGSQIHTIDQNRNITVYQPKISKLQYVFPTQGIFLGTDSLGGLHYSNNIQFEKSTSIQLFTNKPFTLKYRKGLLIAQTTGSQIMTLRLKLDSQNLNKEEEDIVLVELQEVHRFFQKIKTLQTQFQQYQNKTILKIEEEKKRYEENLKENTDKFENQIYFMQKKLQQVQSEKIRQEKQNGKTFDDLQVGQIKNLNDIERMYDLKIKLQKEKYLTLEQQTLEQKMKYENMISDLQKKYHTDIGVVRKDYMEKLKDQVNKNEDKKSKQLQYKKKMELKLINLEEESELTLYQIQKSKDNTIKSLIEKNTKLQREYDSNLVAQHSLNKDFRELERKLQENIQKLKKSQKIVQESTSRVYVLEKQIEKKDNIIDEKNATIKQQVHQIDGLEKAKYVLSFKTVEIRNELEPKQSFIDKLKTQLLKLDGEYKVETKKNFELSQKIQKLEKVVGITKKQNHEVKVNLKQKSSAHQQLCSQIYNIINNIDDIKERNAAFVKVYQDYIKDQKMKIKGRKTDNTSQEINRHLIHVEQSLQQVANGNEKMLKGKEKQVIRKMKENAQLVYDLNVMRKKENGYLSDIKEKETQIARLKRQLNETAQVHKSTRANTANTGITRKLISREVNSQNPDVLELSIRRQSDYLIPDKGRKGRIMSAHKTMAWRQDSRKDRTRISDIARELESAKNTIKRQDRMIEELNQRLLGMPEQNY